MISILKDKSLLGVLLFSLVLRIVYLFLNQPLWWDTYVYIGIGKYIFSSGTLGFFESFRPMIHPLILGFFWKLHINPLWVGKILDIVFSLASIVGIYLIGTKIYNRRVGLLSSILLSITPLFLLFTGFVLTEPLAIFLALLGILLLITSQKPSYTFFAGLVFGLSFLTKFPFGIFFACTMIIVLRFRTMRQGLYLAAGFMMPVIPFLQYNYSRYGSIFEPFRTASEIVNTATWNYGSGVLFYFWHFFAANMLYFLFFLYLYYFVKEQHYLKEAESLITVVALCGLLYFTFLVPRKETRYLVMIVPMLALGVSYSWNRIYLFLSERQPSIIKPKALIILSVLAVLLSVPTLHFPAADLSEQEIRTIVSEHPINGTIVTTDPIFAYLYDLPVTTLGSQFNYAPIIYNASKKQGYSLLYINDCDLICNPHDLLCQQQKVQFLQRVQAENTLIFTKKVKNCSYSFYIP